MYIRFKNVGRFLTLISIASLMTLHSTPAAEQASRALKLEGGVNYRDLGGLPGAGGKQIARGKLVRADGMEKLTSADLAVLSSIPIRTVVDFRTPSEVDEAPDRLPDSVHNLHQLPMSFGDMAHEAFLALKSAEETETLMMNIYRNALSRQDSIEVYQEFFRLVGNESALPLLFHCSAGKDRTGVATALILSALGVDKKAILDDYILTNRYLTEKYADEISERPEMLPAFAANPRYLEALMTEVEKEHGSMEAFVTHVLRVDSEKLRALLLEGQ